MDYRLILTALSIIPLHAWSVSHNPDINRSPLQTQDLAVSFNQQPLGYYKGDALWEDWVTLAWDGTKNRAQIQENKTKPDDHFMRVNYPKAGVGPLHSGAQFLVYLPPSDEYWLTYKVRFNDKFDFKLGGKLPGLASGKGKYANGVIPTDGKGWTARLMWVREGELVPYLYYVGMPKENRWGDFWSMGSFIKPDQWLTLTQHIRLNSNGQRNGVYSVWVNGRLVTDRRDMLWRYGNYGQIDSFIFGTYHGGANAEWAPDWNSTADFDDVVISRQMPAYLKNNPTAMQLVHPAPKVAQTSQHPIGQKPVSPNTSQAVSTPLPLFKTSFPLH